MTDKTKILLQTATLGDMQRIFEWRNDPWLVPYSSTQQKVTWEEHSKWFLKAIKDDKKVIYIIQANRTPVGQVHFFRDGDDASVGISIMQPYTGKGYGVQALKEGCQSILNMWYIKTICGFIRNDNQASVSAFRKAGFVINKNYEKTPERHICLIYKVKKK